MDRRDFIKNMGLAGGIATGLTAIGGGLDSGVARASNQAEAAGSISASREAMHGLLETIRTIESVMLTPEQGYTDPEELAEAERAIAHLLHTGLAFWLEADPNRPVFQPYVTPTRKLLGCNPDSIYFFAPIRDDRRYRVRGNIGAAVFTSFTIEKGSAEGHAARGSIAAISDDEMEIAPDGSYEIVVSRDKPAKGNWLRLSPGASQITTRHYHEARQSVAAIPGSIVPIQIEALDPDPLGAYGGDAEAAAHLTWVTNFIKEHAAITFRKTTPEFAKKLGWVSLEPNQFGTPGQWLSASGDNAYGNTHAWYNSAYYELEPDEALVITGRFPECRFANVVLWNSFLQSYDYANRKISLNRRQIEYEDDGRFRIVIAHQDPGVPNWLDTEGRRRGNVYWRYVFPAERPRRPESQVVKVSAI